MSGAAKVALVLAGAFAGGAFDHAVLALGGSRRTPYGVRVGVGGNWALAGADAALALAALALHRRLR